MSGRKLRCTLAFFGIDRRLDLTGEVIRKLVYEPAARHFTVASVGFLWAPSRIINPRSGEQVELPPPRIEFLPKGQYEIVAPLVLESEPHFQLLRTYGDFWCDGYQSFSNLYSQLASLTRTTKMALATQPDIVIFLRPDLLYHDNFSNVLELALASKGANCYLPHWQPHGGMNDRFAICCGEDAIRAYGHRVEKAIDFCESTGQPLHSEKLLKFALKNTAVLRIGIRASRMRADGLARAEDFSWRGWRPALRVTAGSLRQGILRYWRNR